MCSIIYRSSNDSMILKSGIFFSRFQVYQNYGNLMYPKTFFLRQYVFFFIQNVVIL